MGMECRCPRPRREKRQLTTGPGGTSLSASQASAVRRDAQNLVTRLRSELAPSGLGRLDTSRSYSQADLDFWFAASAFADNASLYEQIVNSAGNRDATVLAGRSLVAAAQRVDAAMQSARLSTYDSNAWTSIRRQISTLGTSY